MGNLIKDDKGTLKVVPRFPIPEPPPPPYPPGGASSIPDRERGTIHTTGNGAFAWNPLVLFLLGFSLGGVFGIFLLALLSFPG